MVALAGCGGGQDDRAPSAYVRVPALDDSPPEVEVALNGHAGAAEVVQLERPRLRGTVTGRDEDSGVARVRVSLQAEITCRRPSGATFDVPRRLYFPPSQIERIRSSEGARLPVTDRRSEPVALGRACSRGTRAVAVSGELYGDVANGLGLEAVPPHIRFTWSRAAR